MTSSETAARRESLPRRERIGRRSDFLLAYENGTKEHGRFVVLFTRFNEFGHPRLGITVTRKVGKANVRNRLKRWTREVYRTNRTDVGLDKVSVDFVVNLKKSAADVAFQEFRSDLIRAMQKSMRRIATTPNR